MTIDATGGAASPALPGPAPDTSVVQALAARTRENVQRVIIGKDEAIDLALVALLCRGHLLIEDVPGIGKTTLARALAASLDCEFRRIQFTPDLMPSDVLGVSVFNMQTSGFEFRPGPIFSQLLLADEINRATPRTQSALLEAMQERQVTVDGETRRLREPFLVLATLNPIEMEGTFPLPEAQLDRFMLKVSLGYPTAEEEARILLRFGAGASAQAAAPVVSAAELADASEVAGRVVMEDELRDYMLGIVAATRQHESLQLGASPRAALALYTGAKALAAVNGRAYVLPDDIKRLAVPVLAHRLLVAAQAGLRGRRAEDIVREVVDAAPVPIERD